MMYSRDLRMVWRLLALLFLLASTYSSVMVISSEKNEGHIVIMLLMSFFGFLISLIGAFTPPMLFWEGRRSNELGLLPETIAKMKWEKISHDNGWRNDEGESKLLFRANVGDVEGTAWGCPYNVIILVTRSSHTWTRTHSPEEAVAILSREIWRASRC